MRSGERDVLAESQRKLLVHMDQFYWAFIAYFITSLAGLPLMLLVYWITYVVQGLHFTFEWFVLIIFLFLPVVIWPIIRMDYYFIKFSGKHLRAVREASLRSMFSAGIVSFLDLLTYRFVTWTIPEAKPTADQASRVQFGLKLGHFQIMLGYFMFFLRVFSTFFGYPPSVYDPVFLMLSIIGAVLFVFTLGFALRWIRLANRFLVALQHQDEWVKSLEDQVGHSSQGGD